MAAKTFPVEASHILMFARSIGDANPTFDCTVTDPENMVAPPTFAQASAQFVANVVDFGMNVQRALEAPRFTKGSFEGCDVTIEGPRPPQVIEALRSLGHDVRLTPPLSSAVGGGQSLMHDQSMVNFGGSDPRKDGAAMPEPPHVFQ